jgi:hypothetical protein
LNEGEWARNEQEKALAFGKHPEKVFQPFAATCTAEEDNVIHDFLEAPFQLDLPIKKIKINEFKMIIKNNLNQKKAPGYDLITGKVLKELSEKRMKKLTILFNAILRTGIFPDQWKVAQIILIPKPGKNLEDITSYQPISLLPITSKLFKKILLQKLKPILIEQKLIPDHQFGFRQ